MIFSLLLSPQLLLEWGADIYIKNCNSQVALEVTRNADLRGYLQGELSPHYCHASIWSVLGIRSNHTYYHRE